MDYGHLMAQLEFCPIFHIHIRRNATFRAPARVQRGGEENGETYHFPRQFFVVAVKPPRSFSWAPENIQRMQPTPHVSSYKLLFDRPNVGRGVRPLWTRVYVLQTRGTGAGEGEQNWQVAIIELWGHVYSSTKVGRRGAKQSGDPQVTPFV